MGVFFIFQFRNMTIKSCLQKNDKWAVLESGLGIMTIILTIAFSLFSIEAAQAQSFSVMSHELVPENISPECDWDSEPDGDSDFEDAD